MIPTINIENKVVIRLASPSDLLDIYKVIDTYDGAMEHDKNRLKISIREILYYQGVFVGVYNDEIIGGVAGYAVPALFKDEISYCALFFYIVPKYRHLVRGFIKELELILVGTKCAKIVYAFPTEKNDPRGGRMRKFIQLMGYTELETHFEKRFT